MCFMWIGSVVWIVFAKHRRELCLVYTFNGCPVSCCFITTLNGQLLNKIFTCDELPSKENQVANHSTELREVLCVEDYTKERLLFPVQRNQMWYFNEASTCNSLKFQRTSESTIVEGHHNKMCDQKPLFCGQYVNRERRLRRKHKTDCNADDVDNCLVKKKRVMEDLVTTFPQPSWQHNDGSWIPDRSFNLQCWMQQNNFSQQLPDSEQQGSQMDVELRDSDSWEAAHQKFCDIEDRIVTDDEDSEELESTNSKMPTLVISDSLREELKKSIDNVIPQKIVESLHHSCMELALWKPPEVILPKKLRDSMAKQRRKANFNFGQFGNTSALLKQRVSGPGGQFSTVYGHLSMKNHAEDEMEQ
ncbi:coiled-coil domain-containing protein 117 isoform X2 [Erpetoichthys calabaricus]|uniref:Uncharacterized protein n=1 Tax=Erpetoichthys calabaricus TaxID=27687 RepID=A0A8C4RGS2_ERPCA|nr:coiled-coil domain-containing protein 117 isoform X2 [Erpetoichthys calabaricus]